jgi:transposase
MVVADAHGLPLGLCTKSAGVAEVRLVQEVYEACPRGMKPKRLIGDKAYDSDPLDQQMAKRKVKVISPHKKNRKKAVTQDGRELRRYRKRWKVERLFAWLQNYRRLVVRWERKIENFTAFLQLGCFLILSKYL